MTGAMQFILDIAKGTPHRESCTTKPHRFRANAHPTTTLGDQNTSRPQGLVSEVNTKRQRFGDALHGPGAVTGAMHFILDIAKGTPQTIN